MAGAHTDSSMEGLFSLDFTGSYWWRSCVCSGILEEQSALGTRDSQPHEGATFFVSVSLPF